MIVKVCLHILVWVGADLFNHIHEIVKYLGQLLIFIYLKLMNLNSIGLEHQPIQGFLDFTCPGLGQLTSFDIVTLIIIAMNTSYQEYSIYALGESIGNPNEIQGAKTP